MLLHFPNGLYDDVITKGGYFQGSLRYEEYDTQEITKVTIREDAEDTGYSYGEDGNTYVIEDNFLLYGASDESLEVVARNFFDYAKFVTYTPSELSCKGAPWREVGDLLQVIADKRILTVPILNRSLSGITALKDKYVAKGQETYGEMKNNTYEQLKQLQGRTNRLTRTLDETRSEVSKKVDGEDVVSVINQSAEEILLKGNRVIIESDNFKLSKEGNVIANSFTSNNANITGGNIDISSNTSAQSHIRIGYEGWENKIYAGDLFISGPYGTTSLGSDGMFFMNANGGTGGNVIYIDPKRCRIGGTLEANQGASVTNGAFYSYGMSYLSGGAQVTGGLVVYNSILLKSGGITVTGGANIDALYVSGSKSRKAKTVDYGERLLYCYEMPSPMFGDLGEGRLDETGKCFVFLDDVFAETIDTCCAYQVFLQAYGKGECYVTERHSNYFVVEGTENLAFGWEVKAIQNNYDTMRLEEYQENEEPTTDVLTETYDYLETLLNKESAEVNGNE